VDELAAVIRHGPKAESIVDAARAFAGMDEAFLREADWSASFVLLRGLGRMERIPRGEKRILEAAGGALWGVEGLLVALPAGSGLKAVQSRSELGIVTMRGNGWHRRSHDDQHCFSSWGIRS